MLFCLCMYFIFPFYPSWIGNEHGNSCDKLLGIHDLISMKIVSLKLGIVFLESISYGKTGLCANRCKVPQRHLQCFKTWNNFDISLQNSWPVQNPGKQPSSFDYCLYHLVTMQERADQRATFLLNVEPVVCIGLSPSTERLGRPSYPTALYRNVSNLQTEHISGMVKSPDLDETVI